MYLLVKMLQVLSKERARLELSRNFRASLSSNHISGKNKIGDQIRIQHILDELKFQGVYRPETFHYFFQEVG